jgi:acetyl-CoA/propionyl-CoA carboxylase biotin carboxyl carrier protein
VFDTVLIANRGEIAVRVIRTLRRLGVRSVAVYSDADAGARHVREADVAVRIGPAPARQSYLDGSRILEAAARTGAQAVHPGYGFLAENAAFARACGEAGVVFVGPPVHAIEVMGDKIRAKLAVGAAGVPVVPGRAQPGMTDADLHDAAAEIGYPVLVKPSAGGGGKGMRVVEVAADLAAALTGARREAASSFGDDTLFLERYVTRPRHIEVQVLADIAGTTLHLGERECSLQRRHQKIIEEAPSPLLGDPARERIGAAACATARSVDYVGAGTVEFIVGADRPDDFFFMEMNTRLQVEHPVTEMVTGLDLVEQQLLVAAGEPLSFGQDDVTLDGHAVEARVYAENPAHGFLPTGGRVLAVSEPDGPGLRVDSGLAPGTEVGTTYDPMLSKVIAWGPDRGAALARLDAGLARTTILGFPTNLPFLRTLLHDDDVRAGRLDTGLVERIAERLAPERPPAEVYAAYALLRLEALWPSGPVVDPWTVPSGWRPGRTAPLRLRPVDADGLPAEVAVAGRPADAEVEVDGRVLRAALRHDGAGPALTVDGTTGPLSAVIDRSTVWIAWSGGTWALTEAPVSRRTGISGEAAPEVRSPMPGSVVAIAVTAGDMVEEGQTLLVVEAMKMEHSLRAPAAGSVELLVREGDQVTMGQVLARVDTPNREDN